MADNVPITAGTGTDIATDDVGGVHYQYVKLADGTLNSSEKIGGNAANGLDVDVTRIAAGTNLIGKVQVSDGTSDATVRNLAANDALNVAIVDGSGAQVTSFGGSGGTSSTDDADFTAGSTAGTPVIGVYEPSPTSVTADDMGIIGIDQSRRVKVSVDASTLDVAHDAADSGNPVKVGAKAASALPTAVATGDRANNISDLWGRQLVAHIDPAMQIWRSGNYTTQQTSTALWTPGGGKKIAVTHLQVNSYGTTAGRIILYFSEGAYVEGTSQPLFKGKHSPSATSTPGALPPIPHPIFCTTADMDLRVTTDAGISLDVVVYGYEW